MTETIKYENAKGSFVIDMKEKCRQTLFGNEPGIRVIKTDVTPKTDVSGYGRSQTVDTDTGNTDQIFLDGIEGKGIIYLTPTPN